MKGSFAHWLAPVFWASPQQRLRLRLLLSVSTRPSAPRLWSPFRPAQEQATSGRPAITPEPNGFQASGLIAATIVAMSVVTTMATQCATTGMTTASPPAVIAGKQRG